MESKKYLVTGPPDGQLGFLLNKIEEVNGKNGPFSAAFIMGGIPSNEVDLTSLFNLVKSDFVSKFPVYFVANEVKNGLLEDGLIEELAMRNVHFMRPFGVSKTPEGLRFAYMSGIDSKDASRKSQLGNDQIIMKSEDFQYVEEQFMLSSDGNDDEGLIDCLFVWSWPHEMKNSFYRNAPESHRLGSLIWNLKPRYIFAPSHDPISHFERAPYENVDMKTGEFLHSTRFIALSSVPVDPSAVKKKWIYALNLVPSKFSSLSLSKRPDDCTLNPFLPVSIKPSNSTSSSTNSSNFNYFFQVSDEISGKRRHEDLSKTSSEPVQLKRPPPGYVCKKCHSDSHFYRDCIYKDSGLQTSSEGKSSTYICHICHEPGHQIRNCPKKHERAIERASQNGKVVATDSCWFCLSNPAARKHLIVDIGDEVYLALAKGPLTSEHVIIIPIEHIPSIGTDLQESLKTEMESYLKKVNSLQSGKMAIFFKMSANPSHHYHTQAVLIDSNRLTAFIEFLEDFSIKLGYNFKKTTEKSPLPNNTASFEFSYISEVDEIVTLRHEYDQAAFFPAQYGRQVLSSFLEIEGGSDWKTLLHNEEDETKFVSNLKKILKNQNNYKE